MPTLISTLISTLLLTALAMDSAREETGVVMGIPHCKSNLGPLSTTECQGALSQFLQKHANDPDADKTKRFSLSVRGNIKYRLPKVFTSGQCTIGVDISSTSTTPKLHTMSSWTSIYRDLQLLLGTCVSLSEIETSAETGTSAEHGLFRVSEPKLGGLMRTSDLVLLVANNTLGRDFEHCATLRLVGQTDLDLVQCWESLQYLT